MCEQFIGRLRVYGNGAFATVCAAGLIPQILHIVDRDKATPEAPIACAFDACIAWAKANPDADNAVFSF